MINTTTAVALVLPTVSVALMGRCLVMLFREEISDEDYRTATALFGHEDFIIEYEEHDHGKVLTLIGVS